MAATSEPPVKLEGEQGEQTSSQDVPPEKVLKDSPGSAPEETASDKRHEPIHLDVKVEVEPLEDYEMEALERDMTDSKDSNCNKTPAVGTYKQIAFEEVLIKNEETDLYDSDPEMQMVIDEEALEFSKISAGNSRNYDDDLGCDVKANHYENILQEMTVNNDNVVYYMCGFCIKLWNTLEPFVEHARSVHIDKKIIYVAQNKSSSTEVRLVHAASISGEECQSSTLKYKCPQCDKHFTCSDDLQTHVDTPVHPMENRTIPIVPSAIHCGFCKNCFLIEEDFKNHDNCIKILYCPCGILGNEEDMRQHWKKCNELAGDLSYCPCEETGEKSKMALHLNNCQKYAKVFTRCYDCPLVFYSQPKLKRHIAAEHSAPPKIVPFQTNCCKLQLKSQEELDEHYESNKTQEKTKCKSCLYTFYDCGLKNHKECRITCFACSREFARLNLLEEHMRWHNLCMLYHCKQCTYLFGNAFALSKHTAANKLKEPFTCNCGQSMQTLCEYSTHKCELGMPNVMEEATMDKVKNCDVCQAIYVGLHMCQGQRLKTKSKYSCMYCNEIFPAKLLLSAHETWNRQCDVSCNHCGIEIESKCFEKCHTNVCGTKKKVYPCNICNKQFCNVSFLLAHVVRHHKVKNAGEDIVKYKCNVCSALLKNYMSFRQHRKNKHPGSNEGFSLHTVEHPGDTEESNITALNKNERKKILLKHPRSLLRDNISALEKTYFHNGVTVHSKDKLLVETLKSAKLFGHKIVQPTITKINSRLSIVSSVQPVVTPSTSQQIEYPVISIDDEPNMYSSEASDGTPKIRDDLFSDGINTIDLINDDSSANECDDNQEKASPPAAQENNCPVDQPQPKIRVNIFPSVFGDLLAQLGAKCIPGADSTSEDPTVEVTPASPTADIKPIIPNGEVPLVTEDGGSTSIENVFKSSVPTEVRVKEEIKEEPVDDDDFQMLDSTEVLKEELLSETEEPGESVDDFIASTQELSFPTSSSCPNCKEQIEIFSQHKCSLNVYKCDLCNVSALTLKKYTHHYRNHGFRPRQCPACRRTIVRHSMVTHLQMHLAKNYNCPLYELRKRYKIVPLLKTYMCSVCNEDIPQVNLISHWESHILKNTVTKAAVMKEKTKKKWDEEKKEARAILKTERQMPATISYGVSYIKEGLRLDRAEMMVVLQQLISPRKKISSCSICCKDFQRKSDMKRHLIEHLVAHIFNSDDFDGVFRCEVCAEAFSNLLLYKKHMREHANLTLYQCNICDKAFSDSSNYSKHRKVHGVTSMQCDTCKRKFFSRKMLKQHMEFHTVSPPLACAHCDRVFYYESTLRKHLRNHDTTKPRAAFRCTRCPTVFNNMKSKWDHEWLEHSIRKMEADCPLCDEGYRNVRQLRYHLRTVHKEASLTLQEIRKEKRKKQTEAAGS